METLSSAIGPMELTDPEEKETPLLTYYKEMLRKPQASSRPKTRMLEIPHNLEDNSLNFSTLGKCGDASGLSFGVSLLREPQAPNTDPTRCHDTPQS